MGLLKLSLELTKNPKVTLRNEVTILQIMT